MKAKKSKPRRSTNSHRSVHQKNSTNTTQASSKAKPNAAPASKKSASSTASKPARAKASATALGTSTADELALAAKASEPITPRQSWWHRARRPLLITAGYIVLALFAAYLFYRRFPNNYREPNFYAEDGFVFGANIAHKGFMGALLTTFNGYYIWGIYVIEKLGFVLNAVFFGNRFVDLPRALALVSYGFLGFAATLPVLLFRKYVRWPVLALIAILSVFVPMLGYDYAVIGTIGNLKFAFAYIAMLLLAYRHVLPERSEQFYVIDAALLLCAYTDITVYAMLPFALLRYVRGTRLRLRPEFWRQLVRNHSFQSLFVLGVLLLPQLYVIKMHGVPALKGYLDSPYQSNRTIELFVSRSYLYAVLFPINKLLNNAWVIAAMAVFVLAGWRFGRRWRAVFWLGLYSIFVATFLFVIKRTGVSALFSGYHSGGPDQFFYAQNWMFIFIFGLIVGELIGRLKLPSLRFAAYSVLLLAALFVYAPHSGTFGKNDFMAQNVGTVYADAKAACLAHPNASSLNLPIYPAAPLAYKNVPRTTLCTPRVLAYEPPVLSLGLTPYRNNYVQLAGGKYRLTQTFVSPRPRLNGVQLYFSTFGQTVHSPYTFHLFEADCHTALRTVRLPVGKLQDNAFYDVSFAPLANSQNTSYCFSVTSGGPAADASPLALQFSAPGTYPPGSTMLNGNPLDTDVVFSLHYKE